MAGSGYTHEQEQALVPAWCEARADPGGPEEGIRSQKNGSRPEIAGRIAPVVELVDPPGLERHARVHARAQGGGKALDLIQVPQGSEPGLLPRELVDRVRGEPERAAEQEGIVG